MKILREEFRKRFAEETCPWSLWFYPGEIDSRLLTVGE